MVKPQFSIIIPTLNEEKFLPKLLTSLIKQTVKDFEVIVVDGGSKDLTVRTARRFVNKLPLTVASCKKGVSRQRNLGATMAKAQWLIFVDADSILYPVFIERIISYIHSKHSKCFTTWYKPDVDDSSSAIAILLLNIGLEGSFLVGKPWMPGPLTVVRREVFDAVGGYDESATFGEDHDFGVAVQKLGVRCQIFREMLYIYSMRRFRKEGTYKVLERALIATLKVFMTGKGPKHMPGFVGGGEIYNKHSVKKIIKIYTFQQLGKSIYKFMKEVNSV